MKYSPLISPWQSCSWISRFKILSMPDQAWFQTTWGHSLLSFKFNHDIARALQVVSTMNWNLAPKSKHCLRQSPLHNLIRLPERCNPACTKFFLMQSSAVQCSSLICSSSAGTRWDSDCSGCLSVTVEQWCYWPKYQIWQCPPGNTTFPVHDLRNIGLFETFHRTGSWVLEYLVGGVNLASGILFGNLHLFG